MSNNRPSITVTPEQAFGMIKALVLYGLTDVIVIFVGGAVTLCSTVATGQPQVCYNLILQQGWTLEILSSMIATLASSGISNFPLPARVTIGALAFSTTALGVQAWRFVQAAAGASHVAFRNLAHSDAPGLRDDLKKYFANPGHITKQAFAARAQINIQTLDLFLQNKRDPQARSMTKMRATLEELTK